MKSELPKVLFPVLGRPMIHWVADALEKAGIERQIVVVGYRSELVEAELHSRQNLQFVKQEEQLGTGHAVQMCRDQLRNFDGYVLVVAGDSPLIQSSSIVELIQLAEREKTSCMLGTLVKDNPVGLGRIVRSQTGRFERIVEHKDATEEQLSIREVNMSTYLFDAQDLLWALDRLTNNNVQKEYYLTDCPQILREAGKMVDARSVLKPCESFSINTIDELGTVEAKMFELGYRCAN